MNDRPAKKIIEMARRRVRPGRGSRVSVVREPHGSYGAVPKLGNVLCRTPYIIVGGLATRLYMQERMTLDVDILVHQDDAELVRRELTKGGARKTGVLSIGGGTWQLPGKTMLDVIVLDEVWAREAIAHAVWSTDGLPYADLPYLVLMKLKASRVQDLADVSRMLGAAGEKALTRVRKVIRKYALGDLQDLESLISLGKLEASS